MAAQTWFITGINSGFGRIMTERLLARGDRVAGTLRKPNAVDDLKSAYGDRLWTAALDLTDIDAIHRLVEQAFVDLGHIDVLVNNAGYGLFGPVEGLSDAQISNQIGTNLIGPIHVARAAIPHLRKQGCGRIIQLSTYGGQATHPGASLYHASKWGIEGFMEAFAKEVEPFNIGVTIVEPGGARTAFRAAAGVNLGVTPPAYEGTPAGMAGVVLNDPSRLPKGDPVKMVDAMIASVARSPAPRRLVLGSDAYAAIRSALSERLSEVEAQKDTAPLTDVAA